MQNRLLTLLLGAAVLAAACGDDDEPTGVQPYAVDLVVTPTTIAVGQDSSVTITPTVVETNRDINLPIPSGVIRYEVADPTIAAVSSGGVVTGRSGGTTTVTVKYFDPFAGDTLSEEVAVTVRGVPAASVSLALPATSTSPANTIYRAESRAVRALILSAAGDTLYCNRIDADAPTGTTAYCSDKTEAGETRIRRAVSFEIIDVDTSVATVSAAGLVTVKNVAGANSGTFRVVVTSAGDEAQEAAAFTDTLTITTGLRPVVAVDVTPRPAAVPLGETVQLTAVPVGQGGAPIKDTVPRPITGWSSSAPAVAAVSGTGVVTGVAPGTATITAIAETLPGSGTFVTGSTNVIVQ